MQTHASVRVSLGNQTFIEPRLMHLSVCTARYSFIHLLIYQIVTKNLTLGPLLEWEKTALSLPQRAQSAGRLQDNSEALDEGTSALKEP